MKYANLLFTKIIILVLSCGCQADAGVVKNVPNLVVWDSLVSPFHFPYDLTDADKEFEMPKDLEEISGLGITPDGEYLIAVQDEDGKLFFIDKKDGDVKEDVKFSKSGDYEGVEVIGKDVYVLESNGTIYRITDVDKDTDKDEIKLAEFVDFLSSANDVEGLGFDKKNNRLLLACKGRAGRGRVYDGKKAIYAFNLDSMHYQKEPVFVISQDMVNDYLDSNPTLDKIEKIINQFDPTESTLGFSPSAIAIHPMTGDMYLLSSVGKMLMVISETGTLLHIVKLKKKMHQQPEGMVFDTDGDLYIANEGKKGDGVIYKFDYLPKSSD